MAHVVGLNTQVTHRYVFELRYEFGHLYWDRAGRIAREIASLEGWALEAIDVKRAFLALPEKNLAFNFGPHKLDLSQTQDEHVADLMAVDEFAALADSLSTIVTKHLDVSLYPRIGFRVWNLYPTGDRSESHQVSRNLKLFQGDPSLLESLGEVFEVSHTLVIDRRDHMLRVAMTPFEQNVSLPDSVMKAARARARDHSHDQRAVLMDSLKASKVIKAYPQFGLLVDLDAYIEEPPYPDDLSISTFVARASEDFKIVKGIVLTESDAKRG